MTKQPSKKNVLIIFGGKSGEHAVSIRSAQSIEDNLDEKKFISSCIGITEDGQWHYGKRIREISENGKVLPPTTQAYLPSQTDLNSLSLPQGKELAKHQVDVVFPIIHGTNGEDGRLQGLLEMANLPYVGAGVLGSAMAMDKVIAKTICAQHGIPQTNFMWLTLHQWRKNKNKVLEKIIRKLSLPLFVKPANLGSSVGISKVIQGEDLENSIKGALQYDDKVIVEEGVENIVEIEVSILGNENPQSSVCGSIQPNTEFYDYETKYSTDDIVSEIPANIPKNVSDSIRQAAIKAFTLLNCSGLARVDFFYQLQTNKFFLSELNTLPGFTSISMYPKLWEATNLPYSDLISRLLELAEEKWNDKEKLKYTY